MTFRHLALAGLLAHLFLAGCALQPAAEFYQLDSGQPALPKADRGPSLLLGPLKLADYLQRENLVQREADGRVQLSQQARWAGSLEDEVGQLLLRQLAGRLDTSRIALYPDRVGFAAQWQLVLTISRLDSGVGQPALLEAQWRILDAQGGLRGSRVVRLDAEHDGSLASQVQAQSRLLQQLAEQLAGAVQALPAPTAAPAAPARSTRSQDKAPGVARELPVSPQPEVFRF